MPRPKSDLRTRAFRLPPATLDQLDAIARHRGWFTESGKPNRSEAIRQLAQEEAGRLAEEIEDRRITIEHRRRSRSTGKSKREDAR